MEGTSVGNKLGKTLGLEVFRKDGLIDDLRVEVGLQVVIMVG